MRTLFKPFGPSKCFRRGRTRDWIQTLPRYAHRPCGNSTSARLGNDAVYRRQPQLVPEKFSPEAQQPVVVNQGFSFFMNRETIFCHSKSFTSPYAAGVLALAVRFEPGVASCNILMAPLCSVKSTNWHPNVERAVHVFVHDVPILVRMQGAVFAFSPWR